MSGAPEAARDQNADPQQAEPNEILVKHLAPLSVIDRVEGEDTSVIDSCPVVAWCVEEGRGLQELSHTNCGSTRQECLYSKYYPRFDEFKQAIADCLQSASTKHKAELETLLSWNFQSFEKVQFQISTV